MRMDGVLWKWTNYWNGWQTRWFTLEDGVLSYFLSQEEVNQGCKGSMKVSALEIVVNTLDNTRMDLVIPSEKHIYLRAASSQERQQWLIALGTSKACLTTKPQKGDVVTESLPDSLKTKKSELRLYCDLLMQQVHTVKTAVTQEDKGVNLEKLSEGSILLSATCDTFIKTLEDCMKLCDAAPSYDCPDAITNKLMVNGVKGKKSVPFALPRSRSNSNPGDERGS